MGLQMRLNLDLTALSQKAKIGFWLVAACFAVLIALDWLLSFLQVLFPFALGTPQVLRFESLKTRPEIVSYDALEKSFLSRDLWKLSAGSTAAPAAARGAGEDRLQLTGIFKGKIKKALFRDTQTKQTLFIAEGGTLGNATIKEIKERSIIVTSGGTESEIRIHE